MVHAWIRDYLFDKLTLYLLKIITTNPVFINKIPIIKSRTNIDIPNKNNVAPNKKLTYIIKLFPSLKCC
jgi:hypothetical protein